MNKFLKGDESKLRGRLAGGKIEKREKRLGF